MSKTCAPMYSCATGVCVSEEYQCSKSDHSNKCPDVAYPQLCPNGECNKLDADCLRPCNTTVNNYSYNITCTGYTGCARNITTCPEVCPTSRPVKCPDITCVADRRTCVTGTCSYRCANGECPPWTAVPCNSVQDCKDGSDELNCNLRGVAVFGIVAGILLLLIILITICFVLYKKHHRGVGWWDRRAYRKALQENKSQSLSYDNMSFNMIDMSHRSTSPTSNRSTSPVTPTCNGESKHNARIGYDPTGYGTAKPAPGLDNEAFTGYQVKPPTRGINHRNDTPQNAPVYSDTPADKYTRPYFNAPPSSTAPPDTQQQQQQSQAAPFSIAPPKVTLGSYQTRARARRPPSPRPAYDDDVVESYI